MMKNTIKNTPTGKVITLNGKEVNLSYAELRTLYTFSTAIAGKDAFEHLLENIECELSDSPEFYYDKEEIKKMKTMLTSGKDLANDFDFCCSVGIALEETFTGEKEYYICKTVLEDFLRD